jgi:triosephosphate isomerase
MAAVRPGIAPNVSTPRTLIAGNWKMHGLGGALGEVRTLIEAQTADPFAPRVALCPPATLLSRLSELVRGTPIELGGQDCRGEASGAFTGDLAAEMLADAGARLVILGHSERRDFHHETDAMVAAKVTGALRAGLEPIVCVGESLGERRGGEAVAVVERQLRGSLPAGLAGRPFSVAYEPIWAIGSGLTPTVPEIETVHGAVREVLVSLFGEHGAATPILYGGSVKPGNAAQILRAREVGGALVGGASLKAADLIAIIRAA